MHIVKNLQKFILNNNNNKPLLLSLNALSARSFNTTIIDSVNEKNNYLRTCNVQTISSSTISNVNKFDRLRIKSPFNLHIQSLSPNHKMNKVFMTLYGDSDLGLTKRDWAEMFDFHVEYDTKQGTLTIFSSFTDLGEERILEQFARTLECHLEVPFQSGISVECTTNNNVNIENLETKDIIVYTKKGDCVLNSLKANSIIVNSDSGNIECLNSLHGNIQLSTNQCGLINAQKLIGSYIKLATENNDVIVRDLYTENFNIKTKKSSVNLKNAKGNGHVDVENGKVNIGSMDGQLNVKNIQGDVKVFFASLEKNSSIKAFNGDVQLSFIENINANMQLNCRKVSGHEDILNNLSIKKGEDGLNYNGRIIGNKETDNNLTVHAPKGKVRLDLRDWFTTLKSAI